MSDRAGSKIGRSIADQTTRLIQIVQRMWGRIEPGAQGLSGRAGILTPWLLAAALGLSVMAQYALRGGHIRPGFGLLALAAGLIAAAAPDLPLTPAPTTCELGIAGGMRRLWGVTCLIASLFFLIQAADLFMQTHKDTTPGPLPWDSFGLGVFLWIVGGVVLSCSAFTFRVPSLVPLLLFGSVIALAAFLRLYRFDSLPFGVWIDEAIAGVDARQVLHDPTFRPFFRPITNITGLHVFLYAAALRFFGETDVHALRLVSVGFGVGSVIAAYLVGNQLRGSWFGLLMAFFLAVFHWAINFSRIAMTGIETVFFTLITFYFVNRVVRYGRLRDALWAGLWAGLGLWFYAAFRVTLFPLGVLGLTAWRFWRPGSLVLIAAITATMIATVFPLAIFARIDPDLFSYRTRQVSILYEENRPGRMLADVLAANTEKHLLMFHVEGDHNGRHNLPGDPMLDPISGVVFVWGVGMGLRRVRHPQEVFFLLLLLVGLSGGILTLDYEAPQALRSIAVLPAVSYFCAMGTCAAAKLVPGRRGLISIWVVPGAVLVCAVFYANFVQYFDQHANDTTSWVEHSTMETLAARLALKQPVETRLLISPLLMGHPVIEFLALDRPQWEPLSVPGALPIRLPADAPVTIFLQPDDGRIFEEAQRLYPGAVFDVITPGDYGVDSPGMAQPVLYVIELKPEDIGSVQGLDGGREGVLYAPWYTTYRFWAEGTITLDGQPVVQGESIRLAQGNHALTLAQDGAFEWEVTDHLPLSPVPDWVLYHAPVTSHGLYGRFYRTDSWQGPVALERIDPLLDAYFHLLPLNRPYSVLWQGWLEIPETGRYGLGLRAITQGELILDGQPILEAGLDAELVTRVVDLEAGLHPIEVRFVDASNYSRLHLLWSVDGGDYAPVPPERLVPLLPGQQNSFSP